MLRFTALLAAAVTLAGGAPAAAPFAGPRPWLAPGPIAARVQALMAQMTNEEKAMQLVYECASSWNWSQASWASTGIGSVGIECSATVAGATVADRIASLRGYQQGALASSRLGIPATFVIETSHCGAAGGTIFPMGATQGASWNASLVGEIAAAIALEARAWGGDRGLSPEINVVTDPRFGRTEENFGEEPLLVATMAEAAVVGLQGGRQQPTEYLADATTGIVAEAKHCCVYGFSGLDGGAADVSDATLHNVYLKPWRAFIRAGGRGMMMSHNDLNGLPMHANVDIMKHLFREEWNYAGFFHSDYGNIGALTNSRLAANATMAAALALGAGVDQAFCDGAYYPGIILPALAAGIIPQADLDRAVFNVLAAKFAAGLFDGALPDPARRPLIYSDAHRALARRAATEGAVLLTNRGLLPLPPLAGKRVAVIGPNSGCAAQAPGAAAAAAAAAAAGCTQTPGIDCAGDDVQKINGVADAAACCALCANATSCAIAVFATDQAQCLLKSGCSGRSANAQRVLCDPGKPPPPPTPWTCNAMRGQLGGYSNLEQASDALADNHAHVVTVLEAAMAAGAAGGYNVSWAAGCEQSGLDTTGIAPAAAAAAAADFAVVVLGDGGESVGYDSSVSCGEGADRPSLDIPGVQLALLAAVLETGTPTVVVVTHGRPFTFGSDYGGAAVSSFSPPLDERAGAVLAAWRPGCEGGNAIWDLLTGAFSPSGRLAQSWPRAAGAVRIGGISPQYIKFSVQGGAGFTLGAPFAPLFALGHGLDYLNVSYASSTATVDAAAQTMTVSVAVVNTAPAAGAYVVQVYFTQRLSRYSRFQKQLGGWTKAALPAAGAAQVTVTVQFAAVAYYDKNVSAMVLDAGEYSLCACHAYDNCPAANCHDVVVPETVTGL